MSRGRTFGDVSRPRWHRGLKRVGVSEIPMLRVLAFSIAMSAAFSAGFAPLKAAVTATARGTRRTSSARRRVPEIATASPPTRTSSGPSRPKLAAVGAHRAPVAPGLGTRRGLQPRGVAFTR